MAVDYGACRMGLSLAAFRAESRLPSLPLSLYALALENCAPSRPSHARCRAPRLPAVARATRAHPRPCFRHERTRDGLLFLPVETESKTVHRSSLFTCSGELRPTGHGSVAMVFFPTGSRHHPLPLSLFSFFSFNPTRSSLIQRP